MYLFSSETLRIVYRSQHNNRQRYSYWTVFSARTRRRQIPTNPYAISGPADGRAKRPNSHALGDDSNGSGGRRPPCAVLYGSLMSPVEAANVVVSVEIKVRCFSGHDPGSQGRRWSSILQSCVPGGVVAQR